MAIGKSNIAFVLGNGPSRKRFKVEALKKVGTVFGCNAIYRDSKPDYVVAIDKGMVDELRKQTKFPHHRIIVPMSHEHWEPAELTGGTPDIRRSNAGMNAIREAIKRDFNPIYLIGFDFLLKDEAASTANIYDGTENYGPDTRASYGDNINRLVYFEWLWKQYPESRGSIILDKGTSFHPIHAPNLTGMHTEEFLAEIKKMGAPV